MEARKLLYGFAISYSKTILNIEENRFVRLHNCFSLQESTLYLVRHDRNLAAKNFRIRSTHSIFTVCNNCRYIIGKGNKYNMVNMSFRPLTEKRIQKLLLQQ